MRHFPMLRSLLSALLLPAMALAEGPPLGAEAFERYTTGKSLAYGTATGPFGAEDYLPGRRVRWSYLDGDCMEGHWYEEAGLICFVYEEIGTPQCWSFFLENGRLMARFENDPAATTLYETAELDEPMLCLGPEVGV